MSIHEIISHLDEKAICDIPPIILNEILNERHPAWVSLSSPYRPSQHTYPLRHIHLSSWLSKTL